jgi:hypothetical protein
MYAQLLWCASGCVGWLGLRPVEMCDIVAHIRVGDVEAATSDLGACSCYDSGLASRQRRVSIFLEMADEIPDLCLDEIHTTFI